MNSEFANVRSAVGGRRRNIRLPLFQAIPAGRKLEARVGRPLERQALASREPAAPAAARIGGPRHPCRRNHRAERRNQASFWRSWSRLGRRRRTVLIQGESGTGKEVVAGIHGLRPAGRPAREGQLRRHPRDAARERALRPRARRVHRRRRAAKGVFEAADGGTLLLDEIGELARACRRSSCACSRTASSRASAAGAARSTCAWSRRPNATSTKCVRGRVPRGPLLPPERDPLRMPPLRERREDIRCSAQHFLRGATQAEGPEARRGFSGERCGARRPRLAGQRPRAAAPVERAVVLCPRPIHRGGRSAPTPCAPPGHRSPGRRGAAVITCPRHAARGRSSAA